MGRFSEDELRRYSRQMLLREVGGRGQERLRAATLTLQPGGEEAEWAARYLLRAGVLALRIAAAAPVGEALAQALAADLPPGAHLTLLTDAAQDQGGLTWLHLPAPLPALWATQDGTRGALASGCRCGLPLRTTPAASDPALPLLVGSALALEALQRLCGLVGALRDESLLVFGDDAPALQPRACRCAGAGGILS